MFNENEVSVNAKGGTEIAKRALGKIIDPTLQSHFQVVSSRVRELDPTKIRIFWAHDLPNDPESAKFKDVNFRNQFHKFVFISNWQMQQYQLFYGIPSDEKVIVLESGIDPVKDTTFDDDIDQINITYTSTPQRGLEILVPVFEELAKTNEKIHLHVHSSFKIYGWDSQDDNYKVLYDRIAAHPQMTYHGFTEHDDLLRKLNYYHVWAYPSIWPETSCRAMLEAMSAGLVCVHPNLAALPDTSGSLNVMYQYNDDKNKHAQVFGGHLGAVINLLATDTHKNLIRYNKLYVDNRFNLPFIKNKWEIMLRDLLNKYPNEESRKIQSAVFSYKV